MSVSDHLTTQAPAVSGVIDLDGTEMGEQASTAPTGSVRSFRAGSRGLAAAASPSFDSTKDTRADAHTGTGEPDARRGTTTVLTPAERSPIGEGYANQREANTFAPEAPPERPKAGFTGADPTRPAMRLRPLLMRWFDKGIAEHPGPVVKVEQAGPLAGRPRAGLSDVAGGQAFAGGSTGTQSEGIGLRPNSFRIMPKAWDALLVDTGGPAVSDTNPDPAYTAAQAQRSRSFRA